MPRASPGPTGVKPSSLSRRELRRATLRFVTVLALIYTALVVPWPGWSAAYTRLYHASFNALLGEFDGARIRFRRPPTPQKWPMDTEITLQGRPPGGMVGGTLHSARITGYVPTIEVIALVVATPVAARRRVLALLWGLMLVHAFVFARVLVVVVYTLSQPAEWALYSPKGLWRGLLDAAFEQLAISTAGTFVVPVLIWAAVTIRKSDIERLLHALAPPRVA
ncbi:MAG: hypothetical protein IT438_09285 [Phycisphaerales bacterium]|nr:hypothetical protein [Phycisphaerales bacterium]